MALLNFVALTLCLLALSWEPHQAQASRRHGVKGRRKILGAKTPADGLCASAITVHGYKCQELEVTTKDGYILSIQRILQGRAEASGNVTKKEPVILQHGVMVDGMTWLVNPPEKNLPMVLADNGYDVWIPNSRGTRYSREHTFLNPASDPAYWNWSWDEMVMYDLPAIFDYVSDQTGQKIHYVGHSLGTLVALASFSEGKLVNQLKSAALLSPIAYLSHMTTTVGVVAAKSLLAEALELVGVAEFDPKGVHVVQFMQRVCDQPGVDCGAIISEFTGDNCCVTDTTVDIFMRNEPQPSSTKNMLHLAQTVRSGVLSKFDYGARSINFLHYGMFSPPIYNLSNIPHKLPLFMSYGGKDALSDVTDVTNLLDQLKFHDKDKLVVQYIKDYAHADFIMGSNVKDMVFNDVIEFFRRQF